MQNVTLQISIPEALLQSLIEDEVRKLVRERATEQIEQDMVLGVAEAAKYLNIAKQTLYTKSCYGEIASFKRGGLKFRKSDLDAWLFNNRRAAGREIEMQAANYAMKRKRA